MQIWEGVKIKQGKVPLRWVGGFGINPILPSSASTQLNSISTSIEAEIALFPVSDTHP